MRDNDREVTEEKYYFRIDLVVPSVETGIGVLKTIRLPAEVLDIQAHEHPREGFVLAIEALWTRDEMKLFSLDLELLSELRMISKTQNASLGARNPSATDR